MRLASSLPISASSKLAPERSASLKTTPVITALWNFAFFILAFEKSTLSSTALVRFAPARELCYLLYQGTFIYEQCNHINKVAILVRSDMRTESFACVKLLAISAAEQQCKVQEASSLGKPKPQPTLPKNRNQINQSLKVPSLSPSKLAPTAYACRGSSSRVICLTAV